MEHNIYLVTILLSALVILSYLFLIISKRTKIPTVLMLIFTGVVIKQFLFAFDIEINISRGFIEFIGIIGLIMIVLEAGLELRYSKPKKKLIKSAFLSSLFALLLSVVGIAFLLNWQLGQSWVSSFVYAVPLSVMSSAIIISSSKNLTEVKREFLTYESSFSDIMGILLFDYFITTSVFSLQSLIPVAVGITFAIFLSIIFSIILVWVLSRSTINIKFYLMFATLFLLYSTGKLFHLPALLIMLIFGLLLNNWSKVKHDYLKSLVPNETISETRNLLKQITTETAFLVRTLFFVLFGYSIQLQGLLSREVIVTGTLIVIILYFVRYMYLKLFVTQHVIPELFYAPRGLVTILLFYSIPDEFKLGQFNDGIIFYVIIITSLVMMIGAMFLTPKEAHDPKVLQES
ncbi:cation:proton antiporter [Candidatus Saccharibacteria bacterium]|nr:cation:proton antiporter [Candidatus Saccharibacteria bacterium]